jgi:Domain of unknown function (DUF1857)
VEATNVGTGATSTALMSVTPTGASPDGDGDVELLFTAFYGLKLDDVENMSEKAEQIKVQYTALARNTCLSVRDNIRKWKQEGTLDYA